MKEKADIVWVGSYVIGWDYHFNLEWWASQWVKEYRAYYINSGELEFSRSSSGHMHEWSESESSFYNMDGEAI